jgi:hypothetical protein
MGSAFFVGAGKTSARRLATKKAGTGRVIVKGPAQRAAMFATETVEHGSMEAIGETAPKTGSWSVE